LSAIAAARGPHPLRSVAAPVANLRWEELCRGYVLFLLRKEPFEFFEFLGADVKDLVFEITARHFLEAARGEFQSHEVFVALSIGGQNVKLLGVPEAESLIICRVPHEKNAGKAQIPGAPGYFLVAPSIVQYGAYHKMLGSDILTQ